MWPLMNGHRNVKIFRANLLLPKSQNVTAQRVFLMRTGRVDASKYHITELMSVANVIQQVLF